MINPILLENSKDISHLSSVAYRIHAVNFERVKIILHCEVSFVKCVKHLATHYTQHVYELGIGQ